MNLSRRSILKGVPALFIAALAPAKKAAAAKPETRELLLNRFFIAGYQFYDGPKMVGRLNAGAALTLLAEPKNKYDSHAVEIFLVKTRLGFVPRTDNKHISRLLLQNARYLPGGRSQLRGKDVADGEGGGGVD